MKGCNRPDGEAYSGGGLLGPQSRISVNGITPQGETRYPAERRRYDDEVLPPVRDNQEDDATPTANIYSRQTITSGNVAVDFPVRRQSILITSDGIGLLDRRAS